MAEQEDQRYEASSYGGVSLSRLCGIADALSGIMAVIGTTWYLRHPPIWIGSSTRATVVVAQMGCDSEPPEQIHGKYWVQYDSFPSAWADGSHHTGRMHFDTAGRASFTASDGTRVQVKGLHPAWFNDSVLAVCLVPAE